ncbi:MAG: ATP-binding protein [Candidatus Sumerlaeota bacterium]|nr:ATP-binding protein [Candidatus Sumerlaeota bacterium]
MRTTRTLTIYGALAVAWILIGAWQGLEHQRVVKSAQTALINRARDISYSLGAVIRSQGVFGVMRQPQVEAALKGLVQSSDLNTIALLNSSGEVMASAGMPLGPDVKDLLKTGGRWGNDSVAFVNLIDLSTGDDDSGATRPAAIILSLSDDENTVHQPPPGGLAGPRRGPSRPDRRTPGANVTTDTQTGRLHPEGPAMNNSVAGNAPPGNPPLGNPPPREPQAQPPADNANQMSRQRGEHDTARQPYGPPPDFGRSPAFGRPPDFGRPFWMEEERYKELLQQRGMHGFILVLSAKALRREIERDLWLRLCIMSGALMAGLGLGLAWRGRERSAALAVSLMRAGEMNRHLTEMNLAAAGLAHETRNPLNIVKGLAQLIARQEDATPDIQRRSLEIAEEVDRVAGRLNEFMDYSRPRAPQLAPVSLHAVARSVERALESDKEDKAIQFLVTGPDLNAQADESLLRQLLFNLILNAMQAVGQGGKVEVAVEKCAADEACLEVRDNGPGVPEEARENLFRPYFTEREGGTGLGLAIARQIALAHGWSIEYIPAQPCGACFRVRGLNISGYAPISQIR